MKESNMFRGMAPIRSRWITYISLLGLAVAACSAGKAMSPAKPIFSARIPVVANSSVTPVAPASPSAKVLLDEPDSVLARAEPSMVPISPPTTAGRSEDLPPGATCRIGSMRLRTWSGHEGYFLGSDRVLVPSSQEWVIFDSVSGKWIESVKPEGVFQLISPAGDRAILTTQKGILLVDPSSRERIVEAKQLVNMQWDTQFYLGQEGDDLTIVVQNRSDEFTMYDRRLEYRAHARMPGRIVRAALSANGKKLVAFGHQKDNDYQYEDRLRVFETSSGNELPSIPVEGQGMHKVLLSPDGGLLVTNDAKGLRLISLDSPAPDRFIEGIDGFSDMYFSPFGKRLLVEASDGTGNFAAIMFDVASGKRLWAIGGLWHAGPVSFSPDGRRVILGQVVGVRIFDALSGEENPRTGTLHEIHEWTLSPSGDKAIIESIGYLSWWSTRDCSLETLQPSNRAHSSILIASLDGTEVYSMTGGTLWKRSQRGPATSVELRNAIPSHRFALSPDGRILAIPVENDIARPRRLQLLVIDAQTLEEKKRVSLPLSGAIDAVRFSSDGRTLFVQGSGPLVNGDMPTGVGLIAEIATKNWAIIRSYPPKVDMPDNAYFDAPPEWQAIIGEKKMGTQAALTCNQMSCLVLSLPKR